MIRLTEKSVFEVKANYDSANAAASECLKDMAILQRNVFAVIVALPRVFFCGSRCLRRERGAFKEFQCSAARQHNTLVLQVGTYLQKVPSHVHFLPRDFSATYAQLFVVNLLTSIASVECK